MKYQWFIGFYLGLLMPTVSADNSLNESMELSAFSVLATSAIPAFIIVGTGSLVIYSVIYVGENSKVVIKSLDGLSTGSILVSGHVSYGAGQSIKRLTTSAGVILSVAGDVLAFIPNELGKSLIYQAAH